jgi:hypothetical protein
MTKFQPPHYLRETAYGRSTSGPLLFLQYTAGVLGVAPFAPQLDALSRGGISLPSEAEGSSLLRQRISINLGRVLAFLGWRKIAIALIDPWPGQFSMSIIAWLQQRDDIAGSFGS